jgi:hypothetical protein
MEGCNVVTMRDGDRRRRVLDSKPLSEAALR